MESIVKKYQQKFKRIKDEICRWEELQSRLNIQFSEASFIIQSLQVFQDSRNYGALKCVEGIEHVMLAKQMESLQTILTSMNKTMDQFHGVVSSIHKVVRDSKQLVKVGSSQLPAKQLKQHIGIKPTLAYCLDGLRHLEEMHRSEYHLKLSVVSALPSLALKPSECGDLGALQQLLVDQPNIPREEGKFMGEKGWYVVYQSEEIQESLETLHARNDFVSQLFGLESTRHRCKMHQAKIDVEYCMEAQSSGKRKPWGSINYHLQA